MPPPPPRRRTHTPTRHACNPNLRKVIGKASRAACRKTTPPHAIASSSSSWHVVRRDDDHNSLSDRCCSMLVGTLPTTTTTSTRHSPDSESICHVLKIIAERFKQQRSFYKAMAATAAVTLVTHGRQDDINAGLWPLVRELQLQLPTSTSDLNVRLHHAGPPDTKSAKVRQTGTHE